MLKRGNERTVHIPLMLNTAAVHFHVIAVRTALFEGLVDEPGGTTSDWIEQVAMAVNSNEAHGKTNEETQHGRHC